MAKDLPISDNAPNGEIMNWGLFESFCEMLESIPAKALLRAVDAERKMVEDDLDKKRTEKDEYVSSVLGFCNFLLLAMCGIHGSIAALPAEHRAFYGKIVQRLVDAGELPAEVAGCFEKIPQPEFEILGTNDNLEHLTSKERFSKIPN